MSTSEIARLFLVSEPTMAARLTRAKKKIVASGIPLALPDTATLTRRLEGVAQTAYLAFTAGYAPGEGEDLIRADLAGEAVRLVRVTLALCPGEASLVALLALLLLQHSRRDARVSDEGRLVLLADQDRSLWAHGEVAEGLELLASPRLAQPLSAQAAAYTLQAAIAAEHARAPAAERTDWRQIVRHYDALLRVSDTPSARVARAVAVAEVAGPAAGLAALETVERAGHQLFVVRAELLRRKGDEGAARAAFDEAIAQCANGTARAHLIHRRDAVPSVEPGLRPKPR